MMKFPLRMFFAAFATWLILTSLQLYAEELQTKPIASNPAIVKPQPSGSSMETASNPKALYDGLRDPFWPVGFTPENDQREDPDAPKAPVKQKAEEPTWKEAIALLDVRGVMNSGDGKYVAMINNQVVREDDMVSVQKGTLLYRWKVHSISKTGARFEPIDAKRPE